MKSWEIIRDKLLSDRLWALVAFFGVALLNAKGLVTLAPEQIEQLFWATMGFMGVKSLRGTSVGGTVATMFGKISQPGADTQALTEQTGRALAAAIKEDLAATVQPGDKPTIDSGPGARPWPPTDEQTPDSTGEEPTS